MLRFPHHGLWHTERCLLALPFCVSQTGAFGKWILIDNARFTETLIDPQPYKFIFRVIIDMDDNNTKIILVLLFIL